MAKKVEYIKGKDGSVGAPKPKRHRSLHEETLEWIRDHPGEFKLFAGKYAAVTPNGVYLTGDSDEEVWKKLRRDKLAPQNPLVIFVPGLNEA